MQLEQTAQILDSHVPTTLIMDTIRRQDTKTGRLALRFLGNRALNRAVWNARIATNLFPEREGDGVNSLDERNEHDENNRVSERDEMTIEERIRHEQGHALADDRGEIATGFMKVYQKAAGALLDMLANVPSAQVKRWDLPPTLQQEVDAQIKREQDKRPTPEYSELRAKEIAAKTGMTIDPKLYHAGELVQHARSVERTKRQLQDAVSYLRGVESKEIELDDSIRSLRPEDQAELAEGVLKLCEFEVQAIQRRLGAVSFNPSLQDEIIGDMMLVQGFAKELQHQLTAFRLENGLVQPEEKHELRNTPDWSKVIRVPKAA